LCFFVKFPLRQTNHPVKSSILEESQDPNIQRTQYYLQRKAAIPVN